LLHFLLIFEFTIIYLLYVLFVFKIEDNLKKRKSQSKRAEIDYFIYICEFTIIYLLYVLFVFKIEDNLEKRKSRSKRAKMDYFIYIYYK